MSIPEPGRLDLRFARGEAMVQELVFKSGEGGQPLDLTSHWFAAQAWAEDGTAPLGEFQITYLEPAAGRIQLELTAEEGQQLPSFSYWDLLVVEPGGDERVWLRGTVSEI